MPKTVVQVRQGQLAAINAHVAERHKDKLYRPTVGVVVENEHEEVLLVSSHKSGRWSFPQGGVDLDEDIIDALLRELFEETKVVPAEVRKFCCEGGIAIPDMNRDGFTRGKWYYFFHAVCRGRPSVTRQRKEIKAYQWCPRENVTDVIAALDDKYKEKREIMLIALKKATSN